MNEFMNNRAHEKMWRVHRLWTNISIKNGVACLRVVTGYNFFILSADINECDSIFDNNCYWGGLPCINTVGSYLCRCPDGYYYDNLYIRCRGKWGYHG